MKIYAPNLYHCFICNKYSPKPSALHSIETAAFKAGWSIKLYDGQAKTICPNCTNLFLHALKNQKKFIQISESEIDF